MQCDDITLEVYSEMQQGSPSKNQEKRYFEYFPDDDSQTLSTFIPDSFQVDKSDEFAVSSSEIELRNNFTDDVVSRMVEHMNEDHVDALNDYCHLYNINHD